MTPLPQMSLAVVGVNHPNKTGPSRRFEIEICRPGETVSLILEPKNPADPRAVAVFSERGIQLGYLSAERCGRIGALIREGREIEAIFQESTIYGCAIRIAFDGDVPTLPETTQKRDPEPDFWPDPDYPDE